MTTSPLLAGKSSIYNGFVGLRQSNLVMNYEKNSPGRSILSLSESFHGSRILSLTPIAGFLNLT